MYILSRKSIRMINSIKSSSPKATTQAKTHHIDTSPFRRQLIPMRFKKITRALGFGQPRVNRLKTRKLTSRKLIFSGMEIELEKRQLLATFNYNSGTGLLAIVANHDRHDRHLEWHVDGGCRQFRYGPGCQLYGQHRPDSDHKRCSQLRFSVLFWDIHWEFCG